MRAGQNVAAGVVLRRLSSRRSPLRHLYRFRLRRSPLKSPSLFGRRDDPFHSFRTYSAFSLGRFDFGGPWFRAEMNIKGMSNRLPRMRMGAEPSSHVHT
jgi:hypothetical protein